MAEYLEPIIITACIIGSVWVVARCDDYDGHVTWDVNKPESLEEDEDE